MPTNHKCPCRRTRSVFVMSIIPCPWMQSARHCPAVRCECGKRYYSLATGGAYECRREEPDRTSGGPVCWRGG